ARVQAGVLAGHGALPGPGGQVPEGRVRAGPRGARGGGPRRGRAREALVTAAPGPVPPLGRVTLVGGGPGAVDLLTVRAWRALQAADVVVADRLGPVEILAELPPHVSVVDVGKAPGDHPV